MKTIVDVSWLENAEAIAQELKERETVSVEYSPDRDYARCPACDEWVELANIRAIVQDTHGLTDLHVDSLELSELITLRCDNQ